MPGRSGNPDRGKRLLYVLLQCSWGLPQTLLGAVFFLFHLRDRHFRYREAVATQWQVLGGISLGLFIFVDSELICPHEYGHTLQSLILGPMYLPLVGIPSVLWAWRTRRGHARRAYHSVYPENWADSLGQSPCRRPAEKS